MSTRLSFVFFAAILANGQSSVSPFTAYDAETSNTTARLSSYDNARPGLYHPDHWQNVEPPDSAQFVVRPRTVESVPVSADQLRHPLTGKALSVIQKAQRLITARDYVHAREELRKATQNRAAAPYAHSLLGQEYVRTWQFSDAVTELQQAVQELPLNVPDHANLGYALLMLGRNDPAEGELRKALELQPTNPHTHLAMGLLCYAIGTRDAEVVEHLEFAARELPAAHLMLAKFYHNTGRADASEKEFQAYEKSDRAMAPAQARAFLEGTSAGR